jgi:hypothetical protein
MEMVRVLDRSQNSRIAGIHGVLKGLNNINTAWEKVSMRELLEWSVVHTPPKINA